MTISYLPKMMLFCFRITITIEISISRFCKIKTPKDIINIILANAITNPLVVTIPFYFNIYYGVWYRHISLFLLEIITVFVEGKLYKKYLNNKQKNPYYLSFLLNISSFLIGTILHRIIK